MATPVRKFATCTGRPRVMFLQKYLVGGAQSAGVYGFVPQLAL